MLVYNKFFEIAAERNLSIEELRKMFSPRTVYRLECGGEISVYVINRICFMLGCQPGDFMEYVEDKTEG
ncbi:MAG: helix-turn-helix domain-containing protein [Porcipelethomonas sp.]